MQELVRFTQYTNELINNQPLYAGAILARAARLWPESPAVIFQDTIMTYKKLYEKASAISYLLQKKGLQPGDCVMILHENSIDFYTTYYGAWQAGAIVAPVNTFMTTAELEHVVHDAQAKFIMTSEKSFEKISHLTHATIVTQQEADAAPEAGDFTPLERPAQELCVLLYTSGTTGLPKGVMLSSYNIMINSIQGMSRFDSQPNDKVLCALPLFHSFMQNACVWSPFLLGSAVIVVPKIERKILIDGFVHKPTVVVGIPQFFALLCMLKSIDLSHVRYCISGGDSMPDKIRFYFEARFGRKICNGYGLTETSPFLSVDLEDYRSETNTVGKTFINIQTKIVDADGKEVPQGQIGTLWIKGPNVMLGYHNAPEATADVIKDGWFNTGDSVRIDSNDKLVICGREKDLIVHKGIKIYPQEVENCIMQHEGVTAVGVIGIKDASTGEIPVAYVASKDPAPDLEGKLQRWCAQNLAAYKVPRKFIIKPELPTTSTNKVNKKELRALAETEAAAHAPS